MDGGGEVDDSVVRLGVGEEFVYEKLGRLNYGGVSDEI